MPAESTVIYVYLLGAVGIVVGLFFCSNQRKWKRMKNS